MVDTRQLGHAGGDTGGDGHLVEALEVVGVHPGAELDVDPGVGELVPEVAQGLVELLLARDAPGDVELTADVIGGVEEGDVVAALGGGRREGEPGRAGADHDHVVFHHVAFDGGGVIHAILHVRPPIVGWIAPAGKSRR